MDKLKFDALNGSVDVLKAVSSETGDIRRHKTWATSSSLCNRLYGEGSWSLSTSSQLTNPSTLSEASSPHLLLSIIRQHILGATSFPFRLLEFGEHTREKNTDLPGCRTALLPRRQPRRNTSSQLPTPAPHLSSSGLSRIHKTSNHRTPCAILQLNWRIRVSSSFRSIARYAESWEPSQTIAIIEMMSSGMIKKKFQ